MKRILTASLVAALGCASLQAHPHAYITCSGLLVTDRSGITAVRVVWTYDEAFSKVISAQADRNGDGHLDAAEAALLPDLTRAELAAVDSSLLLKVNGNLIPLEGGAGKVASFDGKSLQFSVDVPLRMAVAADGASVRVSMVDPSYFCEVNVADDIAPVSLAGRFAVYAEAGTDPNESFYFGSLHAKEIWLRAKPAAAGMVMVAALTDVPRLADSDPLPVP